MTPELLLVEADRRVKELIAERDGALAVASGYMRERDTQRVLLDQQREEIARLRKQISELIDSMEKISELADYSR